MTDHNKEKESFKLDFSGFILSLNTSALIHLGEIPDPESKQRLVNLPAAKHTIDILEQKLIDDVIYNLKMKVLKS